MCGFVGIFGEFENAKSKLARMIDAISHRGPDDNGIWLDSQSEIGLGHARLAVVDLSEAGQQPMREANGRYVIAFNGEIYNHKKIRAELELEGCAVAWRGHSDTETLLASISFWGVEAALAKAVGMFAFALWDKEKKELCLARDRVGEKPLYYGWCDGKHIFSSELHAFRADIGLNLEIDRDAVAAYFRFKYIPAPHSIYKGIYKLQPGTFARFKLGSKEPIVKSYWSAVERYKEQSGNVYKGTDAEAILQLDQLLNESVQQQLMSDVPIGTFLSGGIDSSIISALAQKNSSGPINTFSIGFSEDKYNEAVYAKQVAEHLGTNHTELYVTSDAARDVIPKLPFIYDEPFADASQIPTYLVSEMARQNITVALSGDGGDELFCGYNRYLYAESLWGKIQVLPKPLRSMMAKGLTSVPPSLLNSAAQLPLMGRYPMLGDKLHKSAESLHSGSIDELYLNLISHWKHPESLVKGAVERDSILSISKSHTAQLADLSAMMLKDFLQYLPDDILVKVDRAAMSVSLETRVPFLDHKVVEFAWSLPQSVKIRDGKSKWILREVLHKYVEKSLFERPKMGFSVPIDNWLRGPLKVWMLDLLNEREIEQQGILDAKMVTRKVNEHLSGRRNWADQLWSVLMFQSWMAQNA